MSESRVELRHDEAKFVNVIRFYCLYEALIPAKRERTLTRHSLATQSSRNSYAYEIYKFDMRFGYFV